MLFSNVNTESTEREFEFGTISQICLGEKGRGRKLLALTCPKNTTIKAGANDYSIGLTSSGKSRIIPGNNGKLYLLLSAKGGYTRRGNGYIRILNTQKDAIRVLADGNGADGDAGRIGFWNVVLIEVLKDCTIKIEYSGGSDIPSDMIICEQNTATKVSVEDYADFCDLKGLKYLNPEQGKDSLFSEIFWDQI